MTIAYFGTGLLGSGFVRRQLERGTAVHVWNRSPEKARALVADGALFFDDPAAALVGVDRIHLTLADDASVDAVLEPLAGAIAAATPIVDHTTLAPTLTAARVKRWTERGKRYVHAPVFMGPSNARDASGVMMTSTSAANYDDLKAALEAMTGKLVYLGDDPLRAAAFKLFGNLLVIAIAGAVADVNRLAGAVGISTADAMSLFSFFNPSAIIAARAARVSSGDFAPSFEATMARKDVRLMIEEAGRHGVELGIMPAVAAVFDEAIARGYGAQDSGAIARLDGRA
jgi:3-hydroxyisobutyrate dehydrogenase-like beta-hydroxyacid dehydrogenase